MAEMPRYDTSGSRSIHATEQQYQWTQIIDAGFPKSVNQVLHAGRSNGAATKAGNIGTFLVERLVPFVQDGKRPRNHFSRGTWVIENSDESFNSEFVSYPRQSRGRSITEHFILQERDQARRDSGIANRSQRFNCWKGQKEILRVSNPQKSLDGLLRAQLTESFNGVIDNIRVFIAKSIHQGRNGA